MKYKFLNKMISIMGFPIPIISELCIFVDWAIYAVASFALQTFFQLAEISSTIFTDVSNSEVYSTVQSILSRIMVLAGVYALFRLGIMLINLMINPDNTKKVVQTGMDFIKGAIIAVVLLASSKLIFSQLGEFQYLVLNSENRLIPKLIYGTDIENPVTYSDKKEADMFTNRVWSVFFQPRDGYATEGAKKAWENVRNGNATILSMIGRQYNEFDYYPFISGIVGMMLIYYFAIFSVELGARIIKLITLQVLSPIPIIMSVDPSQKSKLNNFFKAYLAIYLQIFVRVFTIYIAFIVLDLIQTVLSDYGSGLLTNSTSSARIMVGNFIIDIIMIFAVFQAAKELPKVVEDALGLKLGIQTSGKGSFGALVGGIVGGGIGAVGGTIGGIAGARTSGSNWGTAIGTGLMGLGTGLIGGVSSGSRGKNIAEKVSGVSNSIRGAHRTGDIVASVGGFGNYAKAKLDANTGYLSRLERETQKAEDQKSLYKGFEDAVYADYAESKISVTDGTGRTIQQKVGKMEDDSKVYNAQLAYDQYRQTVLTGGAPIDEDKRQELSQAVKDAQNEWKDRAFEWFAKENLVETQQQLDPSTGQPLEMIRESAPKVKYDPTNYSSLSDSQRAHYDITRASRGEAFLPDLDHDARRRVGMPQGYESSQFRQTFKNRYNKIEDRAKDLKAEKQSDRARNAQKAMPPKGPMMDRYFGGGGGPKPPKK